MATYIGNDGQIAFGILEFLGAREPTWIKTTTAPLAQELGQILWQALQAAAKDCTSQLFVNDHSAAGRFNGECRRRLRYPDDGVAPLTRHIDRVSQILHDLARLLTPVSAQERGLVHELWPLSRHPETTRRSPPQRLSGR